jgi:hypothetical protein
MFFIPIILRVMTNQRQGCSKQTTCLLYNCVKQMSKENSFNNHGKRSFNTKIHFTLSSHLFHTRPILITFVVSYRSWGGPSPPSASLPSREMCDGRRGTTFTNDVLRFVRDFLRGGKWVGGGCVFRSLVYQSGGLFWDNYCVNPSRGHKSGVCR